MWLICLILCCRRHHDVLWRCIEGDILQITIVWFQIAGSRDKTAERRLTNTRIELVVAGLGMMSFLVLGLELLELPGSYLCIIQIEIAATSFA